MQELIPITKCTLSGKTIDSVNARDLYSGLGLSEAHWAKWSKNNIVKNTFFTEGQDWTGFTLEVNGNSSNGYAVSIEFAKHICMTAKTEKAHKYRNYFIECERKVNSQQALPTTYLEALQFLITAEVEKQKALDEVAKLNSLIDNEFGYSSIIRAATYAGVHETTFNWRTLKPIAIGLGLPPKRVPSPRFGYQNLYPIKAFQEAYPHIDFDDLKPELVEDKAQLVIS
jgi:phage anti-repressor protein